MDSTFGVELVAGFVTEELEEELELVVVVGLALGRCEDVGARFE
jgi:hypothetical protein